MLTLQVANIGDSAGSLFADNQTILDGELVEYSASSTATNMGVLRTLVWG